MLDITYEKTDILIFISIILSISLLTHLVVYEGFVSILNIQWLLTVRILFIVLWLSFICSQILVSKYNNVFTKVFYRASVVWLGFLFYFFLATCVYGIIIGIVEVIQPGGDFQNIGLGLFVVASLVSIYGLIHAVDTKSLQVSVILENLPLVWKGRKIVWISDVHLGQIRTEKFLAKIVEKINQANPDLVFIGGDLYDGVVCDEVKIIEPLKNIRAKFGMFLITGNHDGFSDKATSRDVAAIEAAGITVLRNKLIDVDGLQIIGVDYKSTIYPQQFSEILHLLNIDRNRASILLKHVPSDVDKSRDAGISLQMSGHTHRAQVQPLSFVPGVV